MLFDIIALAETGSTNDDAKNAAEAGAPAGTVIWALRQHRGRGRQGRVWASPEGNLYGSIILRPVGGALSYGLYSFVMALALWDAVYDFLPQAHIELKWPNDVLVEGKKISGILLEVGAGWLVIGIGLNIAHFPENPLYPVTSLAAETLSPPSVKVVLDRVLLALADWAVLYEREGFAPLRTAWLAKARKGAMRVRLPNAEIHGEFMDLDHDGVLHLRLPDQSLFKVHAGDVFF